MTLAIALTLMICALAGMLALQAWLASRDAAVCRRDMAEQATHHAQFVEHLLLLKASSTPEQYATARSMLRLVDEPPGAQDPIPPWVSHPAYPGLDVAGPDSDGFLHYTDDETVHRVHVSKWGVSG
jgi:hypothetical protein